MRRNLAWGFALTQAALALFLFRSALWGGQLLAPLDLLPAIFSKYAYIDPAHGPIPANHHIIDQITYDLPLQWTIHRALQRGEVPWWDPYTLGGRPLLADAHVSGTDPVRWLLYPWLPFELAYNWTRIVHFVLSGLGMLLLLRHLGVARGLSIGWALAYECGGGFVMHFGHPWIQASFLYYPFLWLAWDAACAGRRWGWLASPCLVAGIFYAGNLQSHAYLVVFAACHGFGRAEWSLPRVVRAFAPIGVAGLLGSLMAAPVLLPQLELFAENIRPVHAPFRPLDTLAGVASLSAIYPWALGTFKTLDASKFFNRPFHLGFILFVGSLAVVLALVGAGTRPKTPARRLAWRTALALVGAYLLILSTPVHEWLYMRSAPLALLGLVVLAALGWEDLRASPHVWRFRGWSVLALALLAALATNLLAFVVYPKLRDRVQQLVERRSVGHFGFSRVQELRRAQVQRFPAEISFQNPEAWLGFIGLLALGGVMLRPGWRSHPWVGPGLLILNLLPVALSAARFLPRHPVADWNRLLAGGPEQRRVVAQLRSTPLRLWEQTPEMQEQVFPHALAHLFELRVAQGYAAVRPKNLSELPGAESADLAGAFGDWIYRSARPAQPAGEFLRNGAASGLSRFQWMGPAPRALSVVEPRLNVIHIQIEAGPPGTLVWTDTFYPGWSATVDGRAVPVRLRPPCLSEIPVPAGSATLTLRYEPRLLPTGLALALLGLLATGALAVWVRGIFPCHPGRAGSVCSS